MATMTPVGLRQSGNGSPSDRAGKPMPGDQTQVVDRAPGEAIRCRFCLHEITTSADRVSRFGTHRHTFANPHGIVFEIGCFRSAPGCRTQGPETTEFSWFSGHAWRLSLCGRCLNHLGWRFQSSGSFFFGLILNNLIEIDPDARA